MPRRFNYTGRRKINREDAAIRVLRSDDGLTFDANLRLASYKFDAQARVYVEAYRGASTSWKRFDFGRVGIIQPPANRSLNEFEAAEGILFRVKVSADREALGKLLGEADAIRPRLPDEQEGHRRPLIEPVPADLGSEVWRVNFEGALPQLLINDKAQGWRELVREPLFRSLTLPAVMRQILSRILVIDRYTGDEEDPDDWRGCWLQFCEQLPGIGDCPGTVDKDSSNLAEIESWIDDAVTAFGARSGLFAKFLELHDKEANA